MCISAYQAVALTEDDIPVTWLSLVDNARDDLLQPFFERRDVQPPPGR